MTPTGFLGGFQSTVVDVESTPERKFQVSFRLLNCSDHYGFLQLLGGQWFVQVYDSLIGADPVRLSPLGFVRFRSGLSNSKLRFDGW